MKRDAISIIILIITIVTTLAFGCEKDDEDDVTYSDYNSDTYGSLKISMLYAPQGLQPDQKVCIDATSYSISVTNISGTMNGTGVEVFKYDNLTPGNYTISVSVTGCATTTTICDECISNNLINLNLSKTGTAEVKVGKETTIMFTAYIFF